MISAECISLKYYPGDYSIVQGIKGGGCSGKTYLKKGKLVTQQGFGWGTSVTPSRYILLAKTANGSVEVDVGFYFKKYVGRLTERRRDLIEEHMPTKVMLVDNGSYYSVSECDMETWKQACGL